MKFLQAVLATSLLLGVVACWPKWLSPESTSPSQGTSEPLPQLSPSSSTPVTESTPTLPNSAQRPLVRPSASPSLSLTPKSQFEVLTIYPNPEEAALETESPSASPSPSPTGSGQEEVVIIPAVPTPQVLDFPGRTSTPSKE